MSDKIKIGTPVIINDCDRPCTGLVAIVRKITDSFVEAIYLCKATNIRMCRSSRIKGVTPISDFGVALRIEDDLAVCVIVGESLATYEDGIPREWQPYAEYLSVRKEALRLFLKNQMSKKT